MIKNWIIAPAISLFVGTTEISGLNDAGQWVGSYVDANDVTHGITNGITTPEPAVAILFVSGLLLVGIERRRRSRGFGSA
ncbi:MAG: hypothetical protein ACRD2B_04585 [Terriglobia bacterium]